MVGEAPMISVDITSIPETIGEAFPAHELAQTFCTEPLARDKVVAAVTVGIIAAHEKFGQSVSMIGSASGPSSVQPPPPEYPLPPPLSLPWEDSTAVPATATATSQSPLDASILDLSASLDLPLLNLPSDFPLDPALVTPDPFTNLSLAMPPLSHPSSSGPMNPDDEASVLDWLFGTTNSAPLFDLPTTSESVVPTDPAPALVVTASDPFTAASLSSYSTPDASAFSLPLTWSSSSSSSHSAYASESTSTSQARSRISNLNPITSVDEPTPRKRSAAGRPTPKLPPPSTLLKGKGKGKTKANDEADKNGSRWTSKGTLSMVSDTGARKRALTRPEIEQIQKAARNGASTLASASASKNASVDANRTLVVKDVKRRAEEVREKLKEQLLAVERELWALDIEAEVLSGLRKGAA
ncbi:hypothetical protein DL93DRAFT_2082068 [Clavulina sp. PMI_390]|nr:hypothetical protein DL93DRAFT_2082068 [Clavulina sp. PMI_390]